MSEHKCPFCEKVLRPYSATLEWCGEKWFEDNPSFLNYYRCHQCGLAISPRHLDKLDALNARMKTEDDEAKIKFAEAAYKEIVSIEMHKDDLFRGIVSIKHDRLSAYMYIRNISAIMYPTPKEKSNGNDE